MSRGRSEDEGCEVAVPGRATAWARRPDGDDANRGKAQQGEQDDGLALRFQRDGVVRTVGALIMCKFANSQRLRS